MNLSLTNEIKYGLLATGLLLAGCISPSLRDSTSVLKPENSQTIKLAHTDLPNRPSTHPSLPIVGNESASEPRNTGVVQFATTPKFSLPDDVPTVGNLQASSVPVNLDQTRIETLAQSIEQVSGHDTYLRTDDAQSAPPLPVSNPVTPASRPPNSQWMDRYVIESGDQLDIKFRTTDELNDLVTVRPDGRISLQIVGDVQAAGLTTEQLRRDLISAYASSLQSPDLAVIVRSFSGNSIYVGGEVFAPGRIPWSGRLTVIKAVIMAGGFKDTADKRRVIVRRVDGSCCAFDLESLIECKSQGQDMLLYPNDVVYVPKSRIAKVNLFVDQYINKVLPFSSSFGVFVTPTPGVTANANTP